MSAVHDDPEVRERFMAKIQKTETCWLWTAARDGSGYGSFKAGQRFGLPTQRAHRFSYEMHVGPILSEALDHLCRVRHCVNPAHLEQVSIRENNLRGVSPVARNAAATACVHGHEFTPENTRLVPGGRRCVACTRTADRKRYAAKRLAVSA